MFILPPSWEKVLHETLNKPYLINLKHFLDQEKLQQKVICPEEKNIFQAFFLTPFDEVKVVIVGQDPYHGPGQAHGLCFSVPVGMAIPPSLKNIYQELTNDIGVKPSTSGCLTGWAKQGVLLLNTTLTVRQGEPLSHFQKGWEQFTDAVIECIAREKEGIVFLLWGKNAQEKCDKILFSLKNSHLILHAAHPSPFSAHKGFIGCRHFSKTNEYLLQQGKEPIQWGMIC